MNRYIEYDPCYDVFYEVTKDTDLFGTPVKKTRQLNETERASYERNRNPNDFTVTTNTFSAPITSAAVNATPVTFATAPSHSNLSITSPGGHRIDLRWNFDTFEVITDEPLELAAKYFFEEVSNWFADRKTVIQEEYAECRAELNKYKRALAAMESHIPMTVQNAKKAVGL